MQSNEETIKSSLITFIASSCSIERGVVVGTLDDIPLTYLTQLLTETLENPDHTPLDVSDFSSMISAYLPCFNNVSVSDINDFIDKLTIQLKNCTPERVAAIDTAWINTTATTSGDDDNDKSEEIREEHPTPGEIGQPPPPQNNSTTHSHLPTLLEMFPNYSPSDLSMVLGLVNDNLERGIQILLLDDEEGIVRGFVKGASGAGRGRKKSSSSGNGGDGVGVVVVDDKKGLKERLVERYGFIDAEADSRTHLPTLPPPPPPKLLRYRGGQVVSTKGERFTEVAVTSTGEEVKIQSYLSRSQRLAMAEGRTTNTLQ